MRARYLTYVKTSLHISAFLPFMPYFRTTMTQIDTNHCWIFETHIDGGRLFCGIELVVSGRSYVDWKNSVSRSSQPLVAVDSTFAVIPIGIFTIVIDVATTVYVLHFAVPIVWTSRAVSVTPIVVALATIVLARRIVTSATTRWRR